MNTNWRDFIELTSCVSWRPWVAQGYADICPAISKTNRMELRRSNTNGETKKPNRRLLFDLSSDIKDSSLLVVSSAFFRSLCQEVQRSLISRF